MNVGEPLPFHRLFGLVLAEILARFPFDVQLEMETSAQQQFLDVVVVERRPGAPWPADARLPDGFAPLARHNLITFKSHREALDGFALLELVGHYVAYRKLVSERDALRPEGEFRLFAVCGRRPAALFRKLPAKEASPGVWDVQVGLQPVRVIVVRGLPHVPANSGLVGFSAVRGDVQYAAEAFRPQSSRASGLLRDLFQGFVAEGMPMPYTLADYDRDSLERALKRATPEQLLALVPPEARLAGLPPEARLAGLPPEARLAGLPPEVRLAGLSEAEIDALLASRAAARKRSPRKKSARSKE